MDDCCADRAAGHSVVCQREQNSIVWQRIQKLVVMRAWLIAIVVGKLFQQRLDVAAWVVVLADGIKPGEQQMRTWT